jgi:hypothetical protein
MLTIFKYIYIFYRIVSEIEENLMTNNFNSSSEFITKDNLADEYIKTHMIDDEFKESKLQTVDVLSVRNATINEDIPSFREWTKKQLEEAEKQPGMKIQIIIVTHIFNLIFIINYFSYK